MTSDEFVALPESDQHLELLNGEVILSPRPRPPHQQFIGRLFAVLDEWVESHHLGEVYPEVEMRLDDEWTPAPDLVFVRTENLSRVGDTQILGPVDLAVEVLSPSNEMDDRTTKFTAYAAHNIPWYWLVDLDRRILEEYELVAGKYANKVAVPFATPFSPRLFAGCSIDLAHLAR
jgi:Uma2 family endonuclease